MQRLGPRLLLASMGAWAVVCWAWSAAPDAMLVDDAFGVSFDQEEAFNGP